MMEYSPGPLLKPGASASSPLLPIAKCYNRYYDLSHIQYVQITPTAVIFLDNAECPIFEKRLLYLDNDFWDEDGAQAFTTIIFKKSPRIWDDLGVKVMFSNVAEATDFADRMRHVFPQDTAKLCLPTKTYLVKGNLAKLVSPTHRVSELVNTTLTALAYTDLAEVLGPVYNPDVLHREIIRAHAKEAIQQWLQSKLPPLILIVDDDTHSFQNLEFRDDLEGVLDTDIPPSTMPQTPFTQTFPSAIDEAWLQQLTANYETLERQSLPDSHGPCITIPLQLIQCFLAASAEGCEGNTESGALETATASIKTALVFGLAYLFGKGRQIAASSLRARPPAEPQFVYPARLVGTRVPMVKAKGLPPKWPKVLMPRPKGTVDSDSSGKNGT